MALLIPSSRGSLASPTIGGQDDVKFLRLALVGNPFLTSLDFCINGVSRDVVKLEVVEVVCSPKKYLVSAAHHPAELFGA